MGYTKPDCSFFGQLIL